MGNCFSSVEDGDAKRKNDEIARVLKADKGSFDNDVKLLLLGAGESGKSTIFKQMKIIMLDGYTEDERLAFKEVIYSNTIQSMKVLLQAAENFEIDVSTDNAAAAENLKDISATGDVWGKEIGDQIKALWADEGIRKAFQRRCEFQLNDSASYYFEQIDRINRDDYVPTVADVLRSRVRTTGIVEIQFDFEGLHFRMFDVGGQRNERKKWIHCFENVTAVIFCVALSEYDQVLYEDDTQNRMHESLALFDEICNSRWFVDTSIILFLNKKDLFEDKIKNTDLNVCFSDYTGGCNFDSASKFIIEKFKELNKNDKKQVYPHLTCATDTQNIRFVFNAVKDIILHNNLNASGLM
eukprot:TRINITY_DN1426_c0_g1::TRINITY_DN1426_c0_g1_i1::g.27193::m.27193 TRINITY_DN1426_c0_g1::TRINITY_DN1426_c0_g1_i1::g.27193  ORF type:complete len:352 (+),score=132.92,sp/P16894/GPA1_DICDI/54.34/3e-136,G-alpha/PF00503.15/1.1e-129,Arf/PF00025.16/0.28,Arf/PF00025.16/4.1e-11,Miro/PF08477.8/18,Miro/PF08477.8/1.9,Miro/PF08477.8/2.4e+02,Gtr1_RagA/PF04670.7/3.1,Gtr1_RagA/PF04670.7/0.3,AAA_29/PF13555.1/0.024 TRINITY_DN1426_c0_g1_i1:116-1171(+)